MASLEADLDECFITLAVFQKTGLSENVISFTVCVSFLSGIYVYKPQQKSGRGL